MASNGKFLLCLFLWFLPEIYSEPDIITKEMRIVEGTDRVQGSGIDHSLPYMTPAGFYGPEALYLLHGACFSQSADRYEYTICPFENITQRRILGGKPTLLGVWGSWKEPHAASDDSPVVLPYHVMEYGRGHSCGHSTRKVSVEIVEGTDFGIIEESVAEKPTCSFYFKFSIPYAEEILNLDIINRSEELNDKLEFEGSSDIPEQKPLVSNKEMGSADTLIKQNAVQSIFPIQPSIFDDISNMSDALSTKLAEVVAEVKALQEIIVQLKQNITASNNSL